MVVKRDGSKEPFEPRQARGRHPQGPRRPAGHAERSSMVDRIQVRLRRRGPGGHLEAVGGEVLAALRKHRRGRLPAVRLGLQGLRGRRRLRARARLAGEEGARQAPAEPGRIERTRQSGWSSSWSCLRYYMLWVGKLSWPHHVDVADARSPESPSPNHTDVIIPPDFHTGSTCGPGSRRGGVPVATKEGDVEVIREGLTFTRYFTTEGTASVRRRRMGDPRRGHPELQGGRQRLRAARRRVPRLVVAERHEHRRAEVLPRHARHPPARVQRPPARRPRRRHDPRLGRARTATSRPSTTRRSSPRSSRT